MPLQIIIPGADFSGLGLPKFQRQVAGFPLDDLRALYLFEDGANGDDITTVADVSGNGNDAVLMTGSAVPKKSAYGVGTSAPGVGFLFRSPINWGQSFSAVVAVRSLAAVAAATFPGVHQSSQAVTGSSLANANNQTLIGAALNLKMDTAVAALTPQIYASPTGWSSPASAIKSVSAPAGNRNSWALVAWSFNLATGVVRLRSSAGTEVSATEPTVAGIMAAANTGFHCFGMAKFQSQTTHYGDLALAGLYDVAKDSAGLEDLIVAARTRLAGRGITV